MCLLGYEIVSERETSNTATVQASRKPLILLDDDDEVAADNLHEKDLRTQHLVQGSLTAHPKVIDLKKQLALSDELLAEKESEFKKTSEGLQKTIQEMEARFQELLASKQELADEFTEAENRLTGYVEGSHVMKRQISALQKDIHELQANKAAEDYAKVEMIAYTDKLNKDLALANQVQKELEETIDKLHAQLDAAHYSAAQKEQTILSLVESHSSRGYPFDTLTLSILSHRPEASMVAINYTAEQRHTMEELAEQIVLLNEEIASYEKLLDQQEELARLDPSSPAEKPQERSLQERKSLADTPKLEENKVHLRDYKPKNRDAEDDDLYDDEFDDDFDDDDSGVDFGGDDSDEEDDDDDDDDEGLEGERDALNDLIEEADEDALHSRDDIQEDDDFLEDDDDDEGSTANSL